jgi:predicted RNase H-like HicB family nuclease
MKPADKYHRFIHWSDEDQCYIGYCPDLYFGGVCHGSDEEETYAELCSIVREEIAHRLAKGENLPEPAVRATRDLGFAAA